MKKQLFLCGAVFAGMTLCGSNVVRNPSFESGRSNWIFWPAAEHQVVAVEGADGKHALEITVGTKNELLLQRPVKLKSGACYRLSFKVRSLEYQGRGIQPSLNFHQEKRGLAGQVTPIGNEWRNIQEYFIVPAGVGDAELSLTVFGGKGKVLVDAVSLQETGRVTGSFPAVNVEDRNFGMLCTTKVVSLELLANRSYTLNDLSVQNVKLLDYAFLALALPGKPSINDYYANMRPALVTEDDGSKCVVRAEMTYANYLKVERTLEFYRDKPYVRIGYDVEALSDFECARVTLCMGFSAGLETLAYTEENSLKYRRWSKPEWFSVPRHDSERYLCYLDAEAKRGLMVLGADAESWKEYPGRLLGSAGSKKNFTLELIKWGKRAVRKGDKTSFELFLVPFTDGVSGARSIGKEVTGGR